MKKTVVVFILIFISIVLPAKAVVKATTHRSADSLATEERGEAFYSSEISSVSDYVRRIELIENNQKLSVFEKDQAYNLIAADLDRDLLAGDGEAVVAKRLQQARHQIRFSLIWHRHKKKACFRYNYSRSGIGLLVVKQEEKSTWYLCRQTKYR